MRPVTLLAWGTLLTFATIGAYDTFRRYATTSGVLSPFSGRVQRLSGRQPWRFSVVSNSQMPHRDLEAVDYEIINFKSFRKYIKLSSFSCDDRDNAHKICVFQNLVMHQGWLYYVVKDEETAAMTKLPEPAIFEAELNSDELDIKSRVLILTLKDVRRAVQIEGSRQRPKGQLRVARFEHAIFQRTRSFYHWFWATFGIGNAYIRLCKYFGVCSPEQVQKTLILQPMNFATYPAMRIGLGVHIQAVADLLTCFGPVFRVNYPNTTGIGRPDNRILLINKMLVGIGDEVSEPLSAQGPNHEIQYRRANQTLSLRKTQYMRQCAGLPAMPVPHRTASVLLVNRPHEGGRHIIGLDDVYDQLLRELPSDIPVRLYYPRSETMAQQAAMYDSANIIVVPHGAANTNFIFLPQTATIFALYAVKHRHNLDIDHWKALPSPPYNVTFKSVDCSESTQANVGKVTSLPRFSKTEYKVQAYLLGDTRMDQQKTQFLKKHLGIGDKTWMKYVGYVPDAAKLAADVKDAALEMHAYLKAQQLTMG